MDDIFRPSCSAHSCRPWGLKLIVPRSARCLRYRPRSPPPVRASIRSDVPGPARAHRRPSGRARPSGLARRMGILAALCLVAGIVPGLFMDMLAPQSASLGGPRAAGCKAAGWLSIVPIAEGRSSYNWPCSCSFVRWSFSGTACGLGDPRFASDRLAPRGRPGTAAIRTPARRPVHRRQLRAADPACLRHGRVPRP